MSDDWKIKTGTLYFHLKELKGLITQNENKSYVLTPQGKKLCQWFLGDEVGKTKIEKIDAFSAIAQPVYLKLEQSIFLQVIFGLLFLISIIGSVFIDTLLIGPIPVPRPDDMNLAFSLAINFGVLLIQFALLIGITNLLGRKDKYAAFRALIIANGFIYSLITILLVFFLLPLSIINPFTFGIFAWYILSTFSQIVFVLIITGSLMLGHGIKPERSLICALLLLYLSFSLGLVLNLF